ncbi:serine hydrolase domain-containing protein [Sphingomonas mesophila]|uniref:serine hydrolase domain-containing protein n=1 Tax=Sphingomonas mesophila TaxID=2303576 RepID=UPI0013C2A0BA|nr:serine hydrolase domain-containing protein [Sphingomonas mesophila]
MALLAAGDGAALDAFVDAHRFAPEFAEMEPAAATKVRLRALARQTGGVDVTEWHPEGNDIFFEGTTRKGAIPVEGALFLRDGKFVGIDLQRNMMKRPADAPPWPLKSTTVDAALKDIRAEIDWRARTERFSGTVLIARRGQPVLLDSWGLAARGPDVPIRNSTLHHTASASKMLTTAAVATLIDRGKLALDTPVARAVPALANAPDAANVTIADLLGHRVDYGEYFGELDAQPKLRATRRLSDLMPLVAARTPRRAPPGKVAYSNANYLVLAAAVEAASGKHFFDYVEAHVLRPLGLTHITYGHLDRRPAGAAIGWVKDEVADPLGIEAWKSNDHMFKASHRGGAAGGAWASATDLHRLIDSIAAGKLIRPATLQAMLADRRRAGPTLGSALGFMFRGGDKLAYFGHAGGGGNAGMSASAFIAPDREWSVVVLSNFSSPSGEMLGGQLLDFLAKLPRD